MNGGELGDADRTERFIESCIHIYIYLYIYIYVCRAKAFRDRGKGLEFVHTFNAKTTKLTDLANAAL